MLRARLFILAATLGLIVGWPAAANAGHHLWRFSQLFSNASGSVQFMMLEVNEDNEQNVANFTITTGTNTFVIPNNLPNAQTLVHKWILLATANFAGLPGGVTPDYIIPANFFPTGGGTLNYAGVDVWTYGAVPTDGRNALKKSGATVTTGINAPINFNLQSGSVNLAAAPVPALSRIWIAALVGVLLFAALGLLRRRGGNRSAA